LILVLQGFPVAPTLVALELRVVVLVAVDVDRRGPEPVERNDELMVAILVVARSHRHVPYWGADRPDATAPRGCRGRSSRTAVGSSTFRVQHSRCSRSKFRPGVGALSATRRAEQNGRCSQYGGRVGA